MYQNMTLIKKIIIEAVRFYGTNEIAVIAKIALDILGITSPLRLLSSSGDIEHKLQLILQEAPHQSSILAKRDPSKIIALLEPELERVGQILGCEQDEHAYFISALSVLKKYGIDLNADLQLAEMLNKNIHKIAAVMQPNVFVGREMEVAHILRVLRRKERNHVLIVGDTGVGKTTLAQSSAIACNLPVFQPTNMNTDILYQLITLTDKKYATITFIDELISFDLKQVSSLLAHTAIIATANEVAYRRLSQDNPELLSKFEVISISIPEKSTVLEMLSAHSQDAVIKLEDGVSELIYEMSKKYLERPQFPARAIAILHEAIVMIRAEHVDTVQIDHIHMIISQKTNIPIGTLTDSDKKDLASLPDRLMARVKGQDHAISVVSRTIQRARLGLGNRNRPMGSFLFVGPSGVGKTELAKALGESLFGDSESIIRLDMSEYAQEHTVQRLIGAPPGYIGFEDGGQLTNPVKKKPYSLILLDEIEKAHPRIFDIFLQVLDDGRLTDGRGSVIDFKNTVIIATSNAGIEDVLDLIAQNHSSKEIDKEVKVVLEDYFRLEFLNRFDSIVTFNPLVESALKEIAQVHLNMLASELKLRGITISFSSDIVEKLVLESVDPKYGARGLIRLIQDKIENIVAEKIVCGELKYGDNVSF